MTVTRRILIPTIAFFAIVLLGLAIFFTKNFIDRTELQGEELLAQLNQAFDTQLAEQANLAMALSVQVANQSQLNATMSSGNISDLRIMALPQYRKLKELFDLAQFQFVDSQSNVILSLSEEASQGREKNIAAYRLTVVTSNTQGRNVSGVELAPDGLSMRGVSPIIDAQNQKIGVVDIGIRIDKDLISRLKSRYGADWSLLVSRNAIDTVNKLSGAEYQLLTGDTRQPPVEELVLQATTLSQLVYAPAEAYQSAMASKQVISSVSAGGKSYSILSLPLRDFSGATIGVVDIVTDRTSSAAALQSQLTIFVVVSLFGLIVGGFGLTYITRRVLQPIRLLTETATAIARGDLQSELPEATGHDEIAQLFQSFGSMTRQLRGLLGNMEQRVSERTQDLEQRSLQLRVAAEVARDITARPQLSSEQTGETHLIALHDLLNDAVELIHRRFNFYFVGIFLVEDWERTETEAEQAQSQQPEKGYGERRAILRAAALAKGESSGERQRQIMAKGLRLAIYDPRRAVDSGGLHQDLAEGAAGSTARIGMIGMAIGLGEARISMDVSKESAYIQEPLLAETRSEIALPLRLGRNVIGALDVQSDQISAFQEADMTVLQIIADQLAIAMQNARLIQQLNQTVRELEQASGQMSEQGWSEFISSASGGQVIGYRYSQEGLQAITGKQSSILEGPGTLQAPIQLRGKTIGWLRLRPQREQTSSDGGRTQEQAELFSLAQEAAARLSLVLESTRLLQDAQRRAVSEQLVSQIGGQVRATLDIDNVLRTAVEQIGRTLNIDEVDLRLGSSEGRSKRQ